MDSVAGVTSRPADNEPDLLRHPSVRRVRAALDAAGVTTPIVVLDGAARTAAQAAEALGTSVAAIANSLVFTLSDSASSAGSPRPLLVLTSGGHRVETGHLATQLTSTGDSADDGPDDSPGEPVIGKARAEFVRATTGFAIGGVAPVAHTGPVMICVDASLADHDVVWAAAGHPHTVFPTTHDELLRLTGARSVTVRPPTSRPPA